MTSGKASDFVVHDEEEFFGAMAKGPITGAMLLSSNEIDSDANIGDVLGTVSITAAYVGTPVWSLLSDGNGQFAINSLTGVVTVKGVLISGSTSIRVKVKGTTPPIQTTTFAVTVNDAGQGYTAGSVHLDGLVYLENASLVAVNSSLYTSVRWFKTASNSPQPTLYTVDPLVDNPVFEALINPESIAGAARLQSFMSPIPAGSDATSAKSIQEVGFNDGEWHCVIFSCDLSTAPPRKLKIYIDDVDRTQEPADDFGEAGFNIAGNGLMVQVGSQEHDPHLPELYGFEGDLSDYFIWYGLSILDETGDIPLAMRRLFRDVGGKPVNPATAVAALGNPTMLFSGDSSTWPTNQGTGGSFVIEDGSVTNASTGPSD